MTRIFRNMSCLNKIGKTLSKEPFDLSFKADAMMHIIPPETQIMAYAHYRLFYSSRLIFFTCFFH